MEVFDSPEIAEAAISLSTHFITALGHKENAPLLQKVADKSFITPTALGQYFNEIYNETIAELQNSKAKLVEDITKQLEGNYKKQIENLNQSLSTLTTTNSKEVNVLTQQLEATKQEKQSCSQQLKELQQQLEKKSQLNIYTILLIIAALIIGLLVGKLFM
jgi:exonuclease VII large subunit